MKHAVALSALFAAASQALQFTNSNFNLVPGRSFELTFAPVEDCAEGCNILLNSGEPNNLSLEKNLTSAALATSSPFRVEPSQDWPAGPLSFQITNRRGDKNNWSLPFPFEGKGASRSGSTSSAVSGTTSASASNSGVTASSSARATGSSESSATATGSSVRSAAAAVATGLNRATNSSSSTTPSAPARNQTTVSSSRSPNPTSTNASGSANIPSSGVDRLTASLALAAVAAAMAYLN